MASEASLCCAEDGPRAQLGRGDLVLASEASLCCFEEGARALARARRFWLGERSEPLLHWAGHTHGRGDARAAQTHGPGVRSKILCSGEAGQRTNQILVFFLTKRRQKKTREQFNSEYEKKRLPRRRWVLLKWPILVIFVKKKRVFFQFATYGARARARIEVGNEKKRIFLRIEKIIYRQYGSVLK